MKKKLILTSFLMGVIILFSFISVNAYSPHYLPGGKNYLTADNFFEEDTDYLTKDPFLVKSYTDYVLTVPLEYVMEPISPIHIRQYDGESPVYSEMIYEEDMTYFNDGENSWLYYPFKTTASTNYMALSFDNTYGYFTILGFTNFQLEEGVVFSGYEEYIDGTLIDTTAPYFQTANTIISYFDDPITASEIKSSLQAYDDIDGDLSSSIVIVEDNYTSNMSLLGSYNIVFEVSDSCQNTTQISVNVEVVDVLAPIFTALDTIQAVYPNVYTSQDILNLLSASDNYDGDISNNIILTSDNYTLNSNITGTYQMEFEVSDSSGNKTTYIQQIEVVDNEGPIISGISSVVIGYDTTMTLESIGENLTYTDNYDLADDLILAVDIDDYSNNLNIIGNYQIIFSVTDSSGNKTIKEVIVEVVDQIGPVVYFNESVIQTYTDTVMALPDFVQLLKATNEIDRHKDYYLTVKYDSYTKNAMNPGTYHLSLDLVDNFGCEITKDFEIKVIEKPYDYVEVGLEKSENSVFKEYKEYFVGGIGASVLLISNVVWLIIFKKKK